MDSDIGGRVHPLVQVFCLRLGGVGWIIPGFRPDLCSGLRSGLRSRRRVWMNERRIHHHSWSCARTVVVVVGWLDFMIFGRLIKLVLLRRNFFSYLHEKQEKIQVKFSRLFPSRTNFKF